MKATRWFLFLAITLLALLATACLDHVRRGDEMPQQHEGGGCH